MKIYILTFTFVLLVLLAAGCNDDSDNIDGDTSDGDRSDGDNPDGDEPDGDEPDGDEPDGDEPDGDDPDGDDPDGDMEREIEQENDSDDPDGDMEMEIEQENDGDTDFEEELEVDDAEGETDGDLSEAESDEMDSESAEAELEEEAPELKGYGDIVVGVPGHSWTGLAMAFHGSATGPSTTADWSSTGPDYSDYGYVVASAGDVNDDGYDDVIVGMNDNDGTAYVYHGSASGLSANEDWSDAAANGDWFGSSVASAGDINKDGYADVVIGAPGTDGSKGKAYAYYGSSTGLSDTADWALSNPSLYNGFGISVSGAGDVNNDGYDDVVIAGEYYTGFAYLYLGSASGLATTASWTASASSEASYLGTAIASAGDVNKDGYDDVIVGAKGYGTDQGIVYVYLGGSGGLSATASWTIMGEGNNDFFGCSVASAGDVNGDGYDDVIVGASLINSDKGKAYVYYGSASGLSNSPDWVVDGENAYDRFGHSVASAGDVNGDGYDDVIVGAKNYTFSTSSKGKAYLYLGSESGLSTTATWTIEGTSSSGNLGNSVAAAGNVNGDVVP